MVNIPNLNISKLNLPGQLTLFILFFFLCCTFLRINLRIHFAPIAVSHYYVTILVYPSSILEENGFPSTCTNTRSISNTSEAKIALRVLGEIELHILL